MDTRPRLGADPFAGKPKVSALPAAVDFVVQAVRPAAPLVGGLLNLEQAAGAGDWPILLARAKSGCAIDCHPGLGTTAGSGSRRN
jgi:hypothetical protein